MAVKFNIDKLTSFDCVKCLNAERPFVDFHSSETSERNVAHYVLLVHCRRCSYHIEMLTADDEGNLGTLTPPVQP